MGVFCCHARLALSPVAEAARVRLIGTGGEGGIRTPRYGCPYGAAFVKSVRAGAAQWLSECRARRSQASGLALREQLSKACGILKEIFHAVPLSLRCRAVVPVLQGVLVAFGCAC